MDRRHLLSAILVAAAVYASYRGISCVLRSDRDRVKAVVETLTASFAEGNLRSVRNCLSDDFEVLHRRRRWVWDDLRGYLMARFIGGDRLILSGGITGIEIAPEGTEGVAIVTWKGDARWKRASGGGRSGRVYGGSAMLRLRKEGGTWLLARAEARDDE